MADDTDQLVVDMERVSRDIVILAPRMLSGLGRIALRNLVENTPIDVGWARSNWIVSVGAPSNELVFPYSPYTKLGRSILTITRFDEAANAQGAIETGTKVLEGFSGDVFYIQNNEPYISILNEDGTSLQSAAFFVERALEDSIASLNGTEWKI